MSIQRGFDAWLNEPDDVGGKNIDHLNTRTTDCCEVAFKAGYEWAQQHPPKQKMSARELYYHRRRIARATRVDGEGNGDPKFTQYDTHPNYRYPTTGYMGTRKLVDTWNWGKANKSEWESSMPPERQREVRRDSYRRMIRSNHESYI